MKHPTEPVNLVPNPEEVDIRGTKIKKGDTLIHSQYACSIFGLDMEFEDQKEADQMAHLYSITNTDKKEMEYRPWGDLYRLYYKETGLPYVMDCPEIISEKGVFVIDSEYDIPEIGVKKGDPVMVIGGEGWMRGVCRFEAYYLEVV